MKFITGLLITLLWTAAMAVDPNKCPACDYEYEVCMATCEVVGPAPGFPNCERSCQWEICTYKDCRDDCGYEDCTRRPSLRRGLPDPEIEAMIKKIQQEANMPKVKEKTAASLFEEKAESCCFGAPPDHYTPKQNICKAVCAVWHDECHAQTQG